ncbi:tail fiber protein [Escherichia coli]|nr:tail fiber protein [Escherichia coli]
MPVGVPVPWPSATPPTGWLKCNGAAFSSEKYPNLAKVYPTNKLPDLRGEFIRGWDDGRGVDAGRVILSIQGWLTGSHYHNIRSWDAWDNTVLVPNDRGGIVCCRQITPSKKERLMVNLPVNTERSYLGGMKPAHVTLPSIIL